MNHIKITLAGFGLVILSGCSSMGMGETNFSCADGSSSASCLSATEAYDLTEEPGPITQERVEKYMDQQASGSDTEEVEGQPGSWRETVESEPEVNTREAKTAMPQPENPLPVRTPSKVMRVWVAPWESDSGDLNVTGLVYTEVEQRRWTIGSKRSDQPDNIRPLERMRGAMQNDNN